MIKILPDDLNRRERKVAYQILPSERKKKREHPTGIHQQEQLFPKKTHNPNQLKNGKIARDKEAMEGGGTCSRHHRAPTAARGGGGGKRESKGGVPGVAVAERRGEEMEEGRMGRATEPNGGLEVGASEELHLVRVEI